MRPEKVTSPRDAWSLIDVLWSGPDSDTDWSMAIGRWRWRDEKGESHESVVLAQRWDGESDEAKGMPISTGHPVWFLVPEETYPLLVDSKFVPAAKRSFVKALLKLDHEAAS